MSAGGPAPREAWTWRPRRGDLEVAFVGRAPHTDPERALRDLDPEAPPLARARQIHSATVLEARPGLCGEGDALIVTGGDLALCVITADCVPVLLAGPRHLAAIHAGWRGLAAGVIPATLARLSAEGPLEAWVGPAIGPCCYEVSDEVADQVVAASSGEIATIGPADRPHLDLQAAARHQLEALGVGTVTILQRCTRCHEQDLWSYRREGAGAGRNLAFVWRRPGAEE